MDQVLEGGLPGGTPFKSVTDMQLVGIDQHTSVLLDAFEVYYITPP